MSTTYEYKTLETASASTFVNRLNQLGAEGWKFRRLLAPNVYLLEREISAPEATIVHENHFHEHVVTPAVEAWTEEEIRAALLASEEHGRLNPDKMLAQTERYKFGAAAWASFRGNGLMAALRGEL